MRRALLTEMELDELQKRAAAVGVALHVRTDLDGEATLALGHHQFGELRDAQVHLDGLETAAAPS